MRRLASWFGLQGNLQKTVAALADQFDCHTVCVTRGQNGAALWRDGRWIEHGGFEVEVRDTVGAGDAFLAVLLAGLLKGMDDDALLHHANLIGAYVATQHGAVPADQPAHEPPRAAP
jgi:fructokinase